MWFGNISCPFRQCHLREFFCGSIVSRFLCQMFPYCPVCIIYLSCKGGILYFVDEDPQEMGMGQMDMSRSECHRPRILPSFHLIVQILYQLCISLKLTCFFLRVLWLPSFQILFWHVVVVWDERCEGSFVLLHWVLVQFLRLLLRFFSRCLDVSTQNL